MKNLVHIIMLLVAVCLTLFAQVKRYDVKSAQITYEVTGGGTMMGMPIKVSGDSSLIFKEYGAIEIVKDKRVQIVMGQKEIDESITKFENGVVFSVDEEEKAIFKQNIPKDSMEFMNQEKGEEALKSLGGVKTGTQEVAGYKCDVWKLYNSEICVYKGIPLKSQSQTMGISEIKTATSVKLNISIDDKEFELPDYPIKTMSDIMRSNSEDLKNMTPEQKKMMDEMMNNMKGMFNN